MKLSMDENIANFTVAEANMIRKSIAKKKADVLEKARLLFFKKGEEIGTSKKMLEYVWYVQFKKSFGYSFSQNHTFPYSAICLQEMNLAYHYNKIFWNTACLTINAGADENNENNKSTNYGKIAKAISEIQNRGQKIELPNINKAKFGFEPDVEENEIVFGLMGICGVGEDIVRAIIKNQPYESLDDFLEKMNAYKNEDKDNKFGDKAVITLIKAGCFDRLENKHRVEIMKGYIKKISNPLSNLQMDCGNGEYRFLTELECWRLFGYSDADYYAAERANPKKKRAIVNRPLYKQAGNSIVVPIFESIFEVLLREYILQ